MMKYHIVVVPVVEWTLSHPSSMDDVTLFLRELGSFFSLSRSDRWDRNHVTSGEAILTRIRAVHSMVRDLTDLVDGDLLRKRSIEGVFIGPHQVEVATRDESLIRDVVDLRMHAIEDVVRDVLSRAFKSTIPRIRLDDRCLFTPFFEALIIGIVFCKDPHEAWRTLREACRLGRKIDLSPHLWLCGPNAFNFIYEPWRREYLPCLILAQEVGFSERVLLNDLLSGVVALGSLYSIYVMMRDAATLLRTSYRAYVHDLFEKWLASMKGSPFSLRWFKASLLGLDEEFKVLRRELAERLGVFTMAGERKTLELFYEQYGLPWFPFIDAYLNDYERCLRALSAEKIEATLFKSTPNDIMDALWRHGVEEVIKASWAFYREFDEAYRFYLDLHRRRVESNRFLLTAIALAASIITSMLSLLP